MSAPWSTKMGTFEALILENGFSVVFLTLAIYHKDHLYLILLML